MVEEASQHDESNTMIMRCDSPGREFLSNVSSSSSREPRCPASGWRHPSSFPDVKKDEKLSVDDDDDYAGAEEREWRASEELDDQDRARQRPRALDTVGPVDMLELRVNVRR